MTTQPVNMFTSALTIKPTSIQNKPKLKKTDIIVFPEFYNAMEHTRDPYWAEIFYNCSIKKIPRGFLYLDGTLRYRATETYIVLPSNSKDFCNSAISFFRQHGNMYSPLDLTEIQKKAEEKIVETLTKKTEQWSVVSKSQVRRAAYVREYVERCYASSPQNIRDELFTQINLGFTTGYLTKQNVLFVNNIIEKIDGFTLTEKGVERTRGAAKTKAKTKKRELHKPKHYYFYKNWQGYLNRFEKQVVLMSKSSFTADTKSYHTENSNAAATEHEGAHDCASECDTSET